ncbi:MAG: hypothetical protein ABL872_17165, partial [Lacibacter sp.]
MISLSSLPGNQKVFLSGAIVGGFFIAISYFTEIIDFVYLSLFIFLYGMIVPMFILTGNSLNDLNDSNVFKCWAIISLIFLCIYFLSADNPNLVLGSFDRPANGINQYISSNPISAFRALPAFLFVYWILNNILKKVSGNYIVFTFKQSRWYNDKAGRSINGADVIINIILYIVIFPVSYT